MRANVVPNKLISRCYEKKVETGPSKLYLLFEQVQALVQKANSDLPDMGHLLWEGGEERFQYYLAGRGHTRKHIQKLASLPMLTALKGLPINFLSYP